MPWRIYSTTLYNTTLPILFCRLLYLYTENKYTTETFPTALPNQLNGASGRYCCCDSTRAGYDCNLLFGIIGNETGDKFI